MLDTDSHGFQVIQVTQAKSSKYVLQTNIITIAKFIKKAAQSPVHKALAISEYQPRLALYNNGATLPLCQNWPSITMGKLIEHQNLIFCRLSFLKFRIAFSLSSAIVATRDSIMNFGMQSNPANSQVHGLKNQWDILQDTEIGYSLECIPASHSAHLDTFLVPSVMTRQEGGPLCSMGKLR